MRIMRNFAPCCFQISTWKIQTTCHHFFWSLKTVFPKPKGRRLAKQKQVTLAKTHQLLVEFAKTSGWNFNLARRIRWFNQNLGRVWLAKPKLFPKFPSGMSLFFTPYVHKRPHVVLPFACLLAGEVHTDQGASFVIPKSHEESRLEHRGMVMICYSITLPY